MVFNFRNGKNNGFCIFCKRKLFKTLCANTQSYFFCGLFFCFFDFYIVYFVRYGFFADFKKLGKNAAAHFVKFACGDYGFAVGGKIQFFKIKRRSAGFGKITLCKRFIRRGAQSFFADGTGNRSIIFSVSCHKNGFFAFGDKKVHPYGNFFRFVFIKIGKIFKNFIRGCNVIVAAKTKHFRGAFSGKITVGKTLARKNRAQ